LWRGYYLYHKSDGRFIGKNFFPQGHISGYLWRKDRSSTLSGLGGERVVSGAGNP
jgi:hypothetical protein